MDTALVFKSAIIGHAAATWAMVGVILIVQVVHYPLFASVGVGEFPHYEILHSRRITWVVAPIMILELVFAVTLAALRPPPFPAVWIWVGLVLLAVIWLSTAFLQVPLHSKLATGFDSEVHAKLLSTNLVRTAAWLLRGIVSLLLLVQLYSMDRT